MPSPASIIVSAPVRGTGSSPAATFAPSQCVCTWSWGLQPSTALIDWVSAVAQPAIVPLAGVDIHIGGHTFYGMVDKKVAVLSHDGHSLMQEFKDSRALLQWDDVFGAFNMRDDRIVDGKFVRRYWHVLPANFARLERTWTTTPYTAGQILDFLFGAPTVESPWFRVHHEFLNLYPVYQVDYLSGRKLGTAVQEISEALGLTFTLMGGRYRLVWTLKGVGGLPFYSSTNSVFPANSTNRRHGLALSGNPTRVRVLGDRNLYEVLNVDLEPDWKPAWEAFWDFNQFVRAIFLNEVTEAAFGSVAAGTPYAEIDAGNQNNVGWLLARARANTMTVGQYADLQGGGGEAFRDHRKFGGRSRLQLPVAFYLGNILFRAFRPPSTFFLRNAAGDNIPLSALELVEKALVEVTHHPVTGSMSHTTEVPSDHNGYAIIKGYQVASDAFKTLNPAFFNPADWVSQQAVWQAIPFQVDNSGEGSQFIIFDEPVIKSADLIAQVTINSTAQAYPALQRAATVQAPAVRAALTFAAERFNYQQGEGVKDDTVNASGLGGEYVALANHSPPVELAFGDGETAGQKAAALAAALLNRQFYYDYGGYTVQGSNATQLSGVIDRVTVKLNATEGLTEEVDFTGERARNVSVGPYGSAQLQLEPERAFERRAQLDPLAPGQRELRQESNQLKAQAALLLRNPRLNRTIMETFHLLLGLDSPPDPLMLQQADAVTLGVGTPLFRDAADKNAWMPGTPETAARLSEPVFMGATTVDGEWGNGPVRASRSGKGNVIFARVQGPVAFRGVVGIPRDPENSAVGMAVDYLAASPLVAVGICLEAVTSGVIRLAQVQVAAGAGVPAMYQLMSEANDWTVCRTLSIDKDGVRTVGETDLYIAKPADLRHIAAETIDGDDITYDYTNAHERVATIDEASVEETQVVVPWYVPTDEEEDIEGSIIFAEETAGTGVWRNAGTVEVPDWVQLTLLEQSGRAWALKSV